MIYILAAVFYIGMLYFIVSASYSELNAGNTAGILICAALEILCLKKEAAVGIISLAMRTAAGKTAVIVFAALIAAVIFFACGVSILMVKAAKEPVPVSVPLVIVLGCRVREQGPSLMLEKRIQAAYEYLSENTAAVCIASGGKGSDEPVSEAKCIKDRLELMGISPDKIILEDKSENTRQNLKNSLEIAKRLDLGAEAVVVTSEFHQLRARIIGKSIGMKIYGKSSVTSPLLLPSYWIREWLAIAREIAVRKKVNK